jgi:predicted phage terminase large subunit-like protein
MGLEFELHPKQKEIFLSEARFRAVAAGRRGGKTFISCIELILAGLKNEQDGFDLSSKEVWYVAPTFQQGKDVMWNLLKDVGRDVIKKTFENTCEATLINGRVIKIKGADRPDSLRGVGLSFVVLDEYAFMKPEAWDLIIRPTLSEVMGHAMFIGTPEGKNHFYDLWLYAGREENTEWAAFHFCSLDNPKIPAAEIESARNTMSAQAFRQEYEASFEAAGGGSFHEREVIYAQQSSQPGTLYMAVDPAGFGAGNNLVKSELSRLDECAIAVVEVSSAGWFVHDIISGRWGVRETALRIIKAARDYQPAAVGIEKGSLFNAVQPYLEDEMRRLNVYPSIIPVTHGGKKKQERITWALQGRFEKGRIVLREDPSWNRKFVDQLLDFPNPLAHDDLLDALAYIDQVASTNYFIQKEGLVQEYEPLDAYIGY